MHIGTVKQKIILKKGTLLGGRGANIMLARPEDYCERDKGDYALPEAKNTNTGVKENRK